MKPHIAQTIEDIELKIGFLQRMAEALRSFGTASDIGAPPAPAPQVTNGKNGQAVSKLRVSACKPTKRSAETMRITAAVAKMLEPVTAPLIASKTGVDTKRATNFIAQGLKKGWLERAGRGEYNRSKIFGGGGGNHGEQLLAEIHQEIESTKPKND